jgi:cytochrome c biogenesis protein CcdA
MAKLNKATCLLCSLILIVLFIRLAYSTEQVTIEFLYWDPSKDPDYCNTCETWIIANEDFIEKNTTLTEISNSNTYVGQVSVVWKSFYISFRPYIIDPDVKSEAIKYNATGPGDRPVPNSIVIFDEKGNFTTFVGYGINKTCVESIINAYLGSTPLPPPSSPLPLMYVLAGAFSFGFFEAFSPCLLILLSFVLSYSVGETTRFREGFLKVTTFGIGFIFATVLVFLASVGLVMVSLAFAFQNALTWVIFAIAVFFGLDLLGLNMLKFLRLQVETKSTIQKLSRKLAFTYIGLIILGFFFYFLDPCIAPIFVVMFGTFQQALLEFLPLVLLIFCIGVMIPFIGIGILAGSISKLVRGAYRHRSKIRAVSGIILIAYAIYFIIMYVK